MTTSQTSAVFNPASIRQVQEQLATLGIRPRKKLGQNFLIDRNILNIIISHAALRRQDVVLEIGPGLGILTEQLLLHSDRVIAVEIDPLLAAFLRAHYQDLQLIEADAVEYDFAQLPHIDKVVANLPYAVGNRILIRLMELPTPPPFMLIMTQQDVAARLMAEVGTKDYGILAVFTQLLYTVKVVKEVSPTCFYPAPHVWSTVISLQQHTEPAELPIQRDFFLQLIKWAFNQRRKQLAKICKQPPAFLSDKDPLAALDVAKIDPKVRPENLTVNDWVNWAKEL